MIVATQQLLILVAATSGMLMLVPRFRSNRIATIATLSILAFVLVGVLSLTINFGIRWDVVVLAVAFGTVATGILTVARRRDAAIHSFVLAVLTILSIGFIWACRMVAARHADAPRVAVFLAVAMLLIGLALKWRGLNGMLNALPGSWLGLMGIGLISLPLISGGFRNGAFISFSVPLIGTVQPGELGRLLLILWLARSMAAQRALLITSTTIREVVALVFRLTAPAIVGVTVGIISKDLGPALLLVVTSLVIVFVAGLRWRYIALVIAVGAVGIGAVVAVSSKVAGRFTTLADPLGAESQEALEQVGLGLVAMAHGPTGLGLGVERTVPEWNTDMLIASIAHEMGMGLAAAVLMCLASMAVATWQLVRRLPNDQDQLRVIGIAAACTTQGTLMVAAVFSVAPLTGMPIPFLSFSGSSIVAAGLAGALLVSVWPAVGGTYGSQSIRGRSGIWAAAVVLLCLVLLIKTMALSLGAEATIADVKGRDPVANKLSLAHTGDILTNDGTLVATTIAKEPAAPLSVTNSRRDYPFEMYRNLLGSASFPGIEQAIAKDRTCFMRACEATVLTLSHEVQQVAWKGLAGRTGSVVALDLQSGDIIAYAARDEGSEGAQSDRIRSKTVAPGSVVKAVVGAAAVRFGLDLDRPVVTEFNGIRALGNVPCGGNLTSAMAVSCNPYFAATGRELGHSGLASASEWLNSQPNVSGLPVHDSRLTLPEDGDDLVALGAIGLGNARATPLGLLGMTAQIARGGSPVCMRLLAEEDAHCQGTAEMGGEAARLVADAMKEVVRSGTARNVPGIHEIDAAAKTGTADFDGDLSNATFVAYAPASEPRYAVVVVIEPGPENVRGLVGSRDAGPVAVGVLARALELRDTP